jgi:hypothetical protein
MVILDDFIEKERSRTIIDMFDEAFPIGGGDD